MKKKYLYYVIVGNLGYVFDSHNKREANKEYNDYVKLSKASYGRASNEQVTLMATDLIKETDDVLREYFPKGGQDD